ncbi:MAG: YbaB/EbfC family nucleoid-associated protein [Candidatus Coatesbacteria bacterium]|nr:YbaB/EbfC family nucleoid-associated protein [Candidatus Coatesbacteria bacterium]
MNNFNTMMQQAQKLQKKIQQAQEMLEKMDIEGNSGGGMVKVVVTGGLVFKSVKIDPQVVDPQDVEMLEDLVLAAITDASKKAEETRNAEIGKVTGGVKIPGLI